MATSASASASSEMSEYEKLRQQNIERNKDMLESLGFDRDAKIPSSSSSSSIGGKKRSRQQQQLQKQRQVESIPPELLRRSARAAKLPAPDYKEASGTFQDSYKDIKRY